MSYRCMTMPELRIYEIYFVVRGFWCNKHPNTKRRREPLKFQGSCLLFMVT